MKRLAGQFGECLKAIINRLKAMFNFFNPFCYSEKERGELQANIIAGFVACIIIWWLLGLEFGQIIINKIFDGYIESRMEMLAAGEPDSWDKFVFFDIDTEAVSSLEHPYLFPRGIIASLVQYAKKQKAKLILIDMNISMGDHPLYEQSPETEAYLSGINGKAGDRLLVKVLADIEKKQDEQETTIETKVLIPKISFEDGTVRNSFLQVALAEECERESMDRLFWVSPHLLPSDEDPYVRFWMPYVEAHDAWRKGKKDEILWTMPFLAAMFSEADNPNNPYNPQERMDNLEKILIEISSKKKQLEKFESLKKQSEPLWPLQRMMDTLDRDTSEKEFEDLKKQLAGRMKQLEEHEKQLEKGVQEIEELEKLLEERNTKLEIPWRLGEKFDAVESVDEIGIWKRQRNRIAFDFLSDYSPFLDYWQYHEMHELDKAVHGRIYHWRKEIDPSDKKEKYIQISIEKENGELYNSYLRQSSKGGGANAQEATGNEIDCKDKIVIIGRSDTDLFWTPVDRMPGMYVHGNILSTLIGEQELPHLAEDEWIIGLNLLFLFLSSCIAVKAPDWVTLLWTILVPLILYGIFFIWFLATNTFIFAGAACFGVTLYDTIIRPWTRWRESRNTVSAEERAQSNMDGGQNQ